MSQLAALRALDATLMTAFHAAGFADTATFTPAGGAAVVCRVYVDRDPAVLAQYGVEVAGNRVMVSILRADVVRPNVGDALAIGSETFTLEARISHDESMSRWVVLPS